MIEPHAVDITDYSALWPLTFEVLRRTYVGTLATMCVATPITIEHVGSTAVPGLTAKPIIDIDIVVLAGHLDDTIVALTTLGFENLGEQGVPQRWALRAPEGLPATHTYVVPEGGLALRNHLAVRDTLRTTPELCERYCALKRSLARAGTDRASYTAAKTSIITEVLMHAGMDPSEIETIRSLNDPNSPRVH